MGVEGEYWDHDEEVQNYVLNNSEDVEATEGLEKTLQVLTSLRQENHALQHNFDQLTGLHIGLREAYQQLHETFQALRAEKAALETASKRQAADYSAALENVQRDADSVKARFTTPKGIELLKTQLAEELEGPYKVKLEAVSKIAKLTKDALTKLQHDYDTLQHRHQSLVDEAEDTRYLHSRESKELHMQLAELSGAEEERIKLDKKLHEMMRKKDELEVVAHSLREEVELFRRKGERAVLQLDTTSADYEKRIRNMQAESSELQTQAERLQQRVKHLESELDRAIAMHEIASSQLGSLQASNASLKAQLAEHQKQYAQDKAKQDEKFEFAVAHWEKESARLANQISEKEALLSDREAAHHKQIAAMELAATSQMAKQKEDVCRLREENAGMKGRLELLQVSLSGDAKLLAEQLHQAKANLTAAQAETNELRSRQSALENAKAESEREAAALRSELTMHSNWKQEFHEKHGQAMEGKQALLRQLEQAERQITELSSELAALKQCCKNREAEFDCAFETARGAWAVERAALSRKCSELAHKHQDKENSMLHKAREKLKLAKRAAAQAHEQVADYRTKIAVLEAQLSVKGVEEPVQLCNGSMVFQVAPSSVTSSQADMHALPLGGLHRVAQARAAAISSEIAAIKSRQDVYLRR